MSDLRQDLALKIIKEVGATGYAVLTVLTSYMARRNYAPTINEIAEGMEISRQTVSFYVNKLIQMGYITRKRFIDPVTVPTYFFVYFANDDVCSHFVVNNPKTENITLIYKHRRIDNITSIMGEPDVPDYLRLRGVERILNNPVGVEAPPRVEK